MAKRLMSAGTVVKIDGKALEAMSVFK